MDLILILAAALALGGSGAESTTASDTTEARSHIIDLGTTSSTEDNKPPMQVYPDPDGAKRN